MDPTSQRPLSVAATRGMWVWIPESGAQAAQLPELLLDLRRFRWRMLIALFVGGIATLALSFLLPVKYESIAIVVPTESEEPSAIEGIAGQLSGLAGLAGVSLPTTSRDNGTLAVATLQSRAFLLDFAKRHGVDRELFSNRFDAIAKRWKPKFMLWGGRPTDDELMESLADSIEIEQDPLTGLITVKVLARAPKSAHRWGNDLIQDLNEQMRVRDVREAERAIEYLNQRVTSTPVTELRQVFYRLIENRMKTVMLAHVSPEYAIRIVDPPSLPVERASPRRWILAALGAFVGTLIVFVWILVRFALRPLVSPQ